MKYLLYNGIIVTGRKVAKGMILTDGERISEVFYRNDDVDRNDTAGVNPLVILLENPEIKGIDLKGKYIFPGGIDGHVHFREPGMTNEADIASESRAAILGGITSFIDMPNTIPQTTSFDRLEQKSIAAEGRSFANFGFHIGATDDNFNEIADAVTFHPEEFGGIKIFMGSSTGNMKVRNDTILKKLFSIKGKVLLTHCEEESVIIENIKKFIGTPVLESPADREIPFRIHSVIRSREACIMSSKKALRLAQEHGSRLHLLHLSTVEELGLLENAKKSCEKNSRITGETSANYLWFCDSDYDRLEGRLKCNPSIKTEADRLALRKAFIDGTIDTIGSDHAPHTAEQKNGSYMDVPSGLPSIQHTLSVLVTLFGNTPHGLSRIASTLSEEPAEIFGIRGRGDIRKGYYADFAIVDLNKEYVVKKKEIAYKCGWSPFEGERLKGRVEDVFVNGIHIVKDGKIETKATPPGQKLKF